MTRAGLLPSSVAKEIRALSLVWLACVVVIIAPAALGEEPWRGMAVLAYFLGAAALGALSIGHEYSERTLSLLLSLPAPRARLLLVKLGVLSAMLLTLWLAANLLVLPYERVSPAEMQAASVLPVLCGLCLAPWLTMACRSPIAGTVFTMVIPGLLLLAGELLGVARYGRGPAVDAVRMALLWRGTLGLCAIGAVATWWMFMRLEAIDGPGPSVRLPPWLRRDAAGAASPPAERLARASSRVHPIWRLVTKELLLQQMTLAVAGVSVLCWLAIASLQSLVGHVDDVFKILVVCSAFLLASLAGSFASAGERQLGTLEWQLLLPVAAWQQWAVKVGVTMGLALVLAIGLPSVLTGLTPGVENPSSNVQMLHQSVNVLVLLAVVVVLLTAGTLYVSSLCTSGLQALILSVPAAGAAGMFAMFVGGWLYGAGSRLVKGAGLSGVAAGGRAPLEGIVLPLIGAGLVALLLRLALENHRSADRGAELVWKQVALIAVFLTAGAMLLGATARYFGPS